MPGSLPVQPQVTMGSGLVDLSGDSGWDGASRCRTTVGFGWALDSGHRNSSENHVSVILFSNTLKCENVKEGSNLAGKVYKPLQRVKTWSISRVPSYEQFEPLDLGLSRNSQHRTDNLIVGNFWWFWAMRHRLAEPCHDRKLCSIDSGYFLWCRENITSFYAKTETQSHKAMLHIV